MMRLVKFLWMFCLALTAGLAVSASTTNTLVWNRTTDQVSADVRGEALWPLLEKIARQTGWHIFVEPGVDRKADTKFQDLNRGDALRKLLGNLNFAFVPQTNGPDLLYVFSTVMQNATKPVAALGKTLPPGAHVPNELLVKVRPGTDIDALAKVLGAKVTGRDDKLGLYRLEFKDAEAVAAALEKLKSMADVATVDYNYLYNPPPPPQATQAALVDPFNLKLNPPGDSGKVVVGLVDTAIQPLGKDLEQFILPSISVAGQADTSGDYPTHATSMAETILRAIAAQNDGTSVMIQPVDIYGPDESASTWSVVMGLQQAINAGANPINMSFGTSTPSPMMQQFMQAAESRGIVFFAATGNSGQDTVSFPAADPGVIAITAKDGAQLAPYANYGARSDMAMPGTSVVYYAGKAWVVQGTSPATAYATGVAAGVKSGTSMNWQQIISAMRNQFQVPQK